MKTAQILDWYRNIEWVTPETLGELPDPEPLSMTHYPMRHDELRNTINTSLQNFGFDITKEDISLSNKGERMVVLAEVQHPQLRVLEGEYLPKIGYGHSNNRSKPFVITMGHIVSLCTNLDWYGSKVFRVRHTKGSLGRIAMSANIAALDSLPTLNKMADTYEVMRVTPLPVLTGIEGIVKASELGIISAASVPIVYREYMEPSFERLKEEGFNVNRWRQAFTATALRPTTTDQLGDYSAKIVKLNDFTNEFLNV